MRHHVPLVDLARQQAQIADSIREGFNRVIVESGFILGDFPCAERLAGEIFSLPIYLGITQEEQAFVVDRLHTALGR